MPGDGTREDMVSYLAKLCLKGNDLTEEELVALLELKDEVYDLLLNAKYFVSSDAEKRLWFIRRKRELEPLPTVELQAMLAKIYQEGDFLRPHRWNDEDDVWGGSMPMGPAPVNTDERVIYEILKERGVPT